MIGGFGVSGVVASMGSGLFNSIAPTFEKSDFGFVNLESPLTTGGDAQGWKDVVIKGNPDLAPAMAASGINVVTMANNHAGDMGDSGLLDTIKYCEKNDIAVVGAGKDLDEAMKGTVLETEDGVKVAFLGFTDVLPVGYPATSSSPGVAPGRADIGAVKKAVKAAAKKADFVIVGWHWNFEYKRAPSPLEESEGKAVDRRRRRHRLRPSPTPAQRGGGIPRRAHLLQPRQPRLQRFQRRDRGDRSRAGEGLGGAASTRS